MSPESKKEVKKLVSVLATSMLVTGTRKEVFETTKATGASKNDEESKGGYPENRAWVLCIQYPITL